MHFLPQIMKPGIVFGVFKDILEPPPFSTAHFLVLFFSVSVHEKFRR